MTTFQSVLFSAFFGFWFLINLNVNNLDYNRKVDFHRLSCKSLKMLNLASLFAVETIFDVCTLIRGRIHNNIFKLVQEMSINDSTKWATNIVK